MEKGLKQKGLIKQFVKNTLYFKIFLIQTFLCNCFVDHIGPIASEV